MYCGEQTLVNHRPTSVRAVSLHCRSWLCETCQRKRHRELIDLAQSGKPTKFITLTVSKETATSNDVAAAMLADAWRRIVRAAQLRWKMKKIEYLAVFEAQKNGRPHLHILARAAFIPQHWLSEQADRLLHAPIVDIRLIKGSRMIANYVTKYVGKAPHKFGTAKRYWHTRAWTLWRPWHEKNQEDNKHGWEIIKEPLHEVVRHWPTQGIWPAEIGRHTALGLIFTRAPPG